MRKFRSNFLKRVFIFICCFFLVTSLFLFNWNLNNLRAYQATQSKTSVTNRRIKDWKKSLIYFSSLFTFKDATKNNNLINNKYFWTTKFHSSKLWDHKQPGGENFFNIIHDDLKNTDAGVKIQDIPFHKNSAIEKYLALNSEVLTDFSSSEKATRFKFLMNIFRSSISDFLRKQDLNNIPALFDSFPKEPYKMIDFISSLTDTFRGDYQLSDATANAAFEKTWIQFYNFIKIPLKDLFEFVVQTLLASGYNSKIAREQTPPDLDQNFVADFRKSPMIRWIMFARDVMKLDLDTLVLTNDEVENINADHSVTFTELLAWEKKRLNKIKPRDENIPKFPNLLTDAVKTKLFKDTGANLAHDFSAINMIELLVKVHAFIADFSNNGFDSPALTEIFEFIKDKKTEVSSLFHHLADSISLTSFNNRNSIAIEFHDYQLIKMSDLINEIHQVLYNFSLSQDTGYYLVSGWTTYLQEIKDNPTANIEQIDADLVFWRQLMSNIFNPVVIRQLMDDFQESLLSVQKAILGSKNNEQIYFLSEFLDLDLEYLFSFFFSDEYQDNVSLFGAAKTAMENFFSDNNFANENFDIEKIEELTSFLPGILLTFWDLIYELFPEDFDVRGMSELMIFVLELVGINIFTLETPKQTLLEFLNFFTMKKFDDYIQYFLGSEISGDLVAALDLFQKAIKGDQKYDLTDLILIGFNCIGFHYDETDIIDGVDQKETFLQIVRTKEIPETPKRASSFHGWLLEAIEKKLELADPNNSSLLDSLFRLIDGVLIAEPITKNTEPASDASLETRVIHHLNVFFNHHMGGIFKVFFEEFDRDFNDEFEKYLQWTEWEIYDFDLPERLIRSFTSENPAGEIIETLEFSFIGIYKENSEVVFSYRYFWEIFPINNEYLGSRLIKAVQIDPRPILQPNQQHSLLT